MTIYRLTPFAYRALSPDLRDVIEAAKPADYLVTLGRSGPGWTCRILSPRQEGVLAEAYGEPSPMVAFMAAYGRVPS